MSYINTIQKLETIKYWAERKMTGTPKELSEKLEVSERTTYRFISILKQMDVHIEYNEFRQSYVIEK